MLTCFNVQKTHYFSNTVHYCKSSMPRISQMRCFLQSLSVQKVIGQLTQFIVIDWTPQWCVHLHTNVMTLTIIASFSFQVSFISSSPRGEQSCVTNTVMKLVCICTQAAVKTISDWLYALLWCDPVPLTHTHTQRHITCKTPHLNSE